MQRWTSKTFLLIAGCVACTAFVSTVSLTLPGNDAGHAPEQPIAYSHRLHAGELGIDCQYCHFAADKSPVAGIPPAALCMNCHNSVTARSDAVEAEKKLAEKEGRLARTIISPELKKLYNALALDDERKPIPGRKPEPLRWQRVHDLPDFVAFDHRVHVSRGVACQSCHGAVETMERVQQVSTLSMGWCVECHRLNNRDGKGAVEAGFNHPRVDGHVSTDCAACHY
jgi:hypothetical protein